MERKAKSLVSIVATLAITLSFTTTAMAVGSEMSSAHHSRGGMVQTGTRTQGSGSYKQNSVQAQGQGSGGQNSTRMQGIGFGVQDGTKASGSEKAQGKTDAIPRGMHVEVIEMAITALNDEDQETLSTYIEAFEDAATAYEQAVADEETDLSSYCEAVRDAFDALKDAAEGAGIDFGLKLGSGSANGTPFGGRRVMMSSEVVEEAIAGLSDEDQEALGDYLVAYQDAVAAKEQAITNGVDRDELLTDCQAVRDAFKALLDAAKDAGISLGLPSAK